MRSIFERIEIRWGRLVFLLIVCISWTVYINARNTRISRSAEEIIERERECRGYLAEMQHMDQTTDKSGYDLDFLKGYKEKDLYIHDSLCLHWREDGGNIITGAHGFCMTYLEKADICEVFSDAELIWTGDDIRFYRVDEYWD